MKAVISLNIRYLIPIQLAHVCKRNHIFTGDRVCRIRFQFNTIDKCSILPHTNKKTIYNETTKNWKFVFLEYCIE